VPHSSHELDVGKCGGLDGGASMEVALLVGDPLTAAGINTLVTAVKSVDTQNASTTRTTAE